jgi:general secretion pathway protein G
MILQDTGYRTRDRGDKRPLAVSRIPYPVSCKGFTLIELIVVIIIVVVLAGTFLSRIPYYQGLAEKAAMEQTAAALQSALVMRYGALMARGGGEKELSILATDNPMTWLQQKPRNYAGEYYDPTPGAVAPGNWMFDLKSRDLIYVVDHGDHFTPGKDGKKWIRFHIHFQYEPVTNGDAQGKQELVGTLLEPTQTYRWFD